MKDYKSQPLPTLLQYYTSLIISQRYWSYDELIGTADHLTVENPTLFIPQLLSQLHIEVLVHGNVDKNEVSEYVILLKVNSGKPLI